MDPNKVDFVTSASSRKGFPPGDRPDIAVAGRSNVGKSSLINCLFGRKQLAKVSQTPGKTRLINFFAVDERFYLVDLPGYGYARRSRKERESWRSLVETYLATRHQLIAMLVLMDIRRGPEEEELMLLEALAQVGVKAICVLTKSDKVAKSHRKVRVAAIEGLLGPHASATVLFSSRTGQGRHELWDEMLKCLNAE